MLNYKVEYKIEVLDNNTFEMVNVTSIRKAKKEVKKLGVNTTVITEVKVIERLSNNLINLNTYSMSGEEFLNHH